MVARTPGNLYPGYPPNVDVVWTGWQRRLARQLQAPLIVADDASHQVPREVPALVAHVVDAIVKAVRADRRWRPDSAALATVGDALDPEVPATPDHRR